MSNFGNAFANAVSYVAQGAEDLWNGITGKTDRDFAQHQSDEAFERQKWLDLNEPSLQVEGFKRAGLNPGLMSGSPQFSSPQIASVNKTTPGLGDVVGLFSGVAQNILGFQKLSAEKDLMRKQMDKLGSDIGVNDANIEVLKSISNMNNAHAKVFNETVNQIKAAIDNLKVQNDYLKWQKPLFQAQTYKLHQEGLTQTMQRQLYGSQSRYYDEMQGNVVQDTKKKAAETNNIDLTTKIVKYNLDHVLPRQVRKIGSEIDLNEKQAGYLSQQTMNLIQDFWIKKPEADYCAQNIHDMIEVVGSEKALKYWLNMSDALDNAIQYNRRAGVPDNPFGNLKPWIHKPDGDIIYPKGDTRRNIYNALMEAIGNVAQDIAAPIGSGLGLKKLFK